MKKRLLVLGMVVALVAALALPMAAFAAVTGVSGTWTAATIEVVAPSPIAFETFAFDLNEGESATPGSVTITLNSQDPDTVGWEVVARDLANDGLMKNAAEEPLSAKLQISGDDITYVDADDPAGTTYSGDGLTGDLPFYAQQTVGNDEEPGDYSITITFTGIVTF